MVGCHYGFSSFHTGKSEIIVVPWSLGYKKKKKGGGGDENYLKLPRLTDLTPKCTNRQFLPVVNRLRIRSR